MNLVEAIHILIRINASRWIAYAVGAEGKAEAVGAEARPEAVGAEAMGEAGLTAAPELES